MWTVDSECTSFGSSFCAFGRAACSGCFLALLFSIERLIVLRTTMFAAAGLPLTSAGVTPVSWGLYVVASFVVKIVCLLGIYSTARWKEATEEKEEEEEEKGKKK